MKKQYFCTLFDSGYLLKGVAMLKSLKKYCPEAHVHVLCMDQAARDILSRMNLSYLTLIALLDLEDDSLLEAKKDRGVAEYCWTLSPCLPWYVLQNNPEIDFITYLDADLLFYSPIQPLFDEIGDSSIAIIEHRFTPRLQDREVNGRFCVEWVGFRRDEEGMACLSRWREQCIEWCYYRLEDGRMGDQKYLDEWPDRYPSCHILQHTGAGVAPWNYAKHMFDADDKGNITVDGAPLIFYHFHQFQLLNTGAFDRLSRFYTEEKQEPEAIYARYEYELTTILVDVRKIVPWFSLGLKSPGVTKGRRLVQLLLPGYIKNLIRKFVRI